MVSVRVMLDKVLVRVMLDWVSMEVSVRLSTQWLGLG